MAGDPREVIPRPIPQEHFFQTEGGIKYPLDYDTATLGAYESIDREAIDEFRHDNWFFTHIPLRVCTDAVNGAGSTTYRYWRKSDRASATFRRYNEDVTETRTTRESMTANIANLASAFSMDVDLADLGSVWDDIWNEQKQDVMLGISDLFNDTVIRGNVAMDPDEHDRTKGPDAFDGLEMLIERDSTHIWDTPIDLTGLGGIYGDVTTSGSLKGADRVDRQPNKKPAKIANADELTTDGLSEDGADPITIPTSPFKSNVALQQNVWMDVIDLFMARLKKLRPKPTFILGNDDLENALSSLGHRTGTWNQTMDDFGHEVTTIRGVSIISMGRRADDYNKEIIPTVKIKYDDIPDDRKPRYHDGKYVYTTHAIVGSFGPNAIQGLCLPGNLVQIRPPESMDKGPWVKKWRVEMRLGMALKSKHACGLFKTIYLPKGLIEKPEFLDEVKSEA